MDGVWKDPAMLGKLIFDDGVQLKARLLERLDGLREHPEKVVQFALMFLALVAIDAVYLKDFIDAARKGGPDADAILGMGALVRFVVFAGWPFALMAAMAKTWTRKDAGRVALAAYAVSASVWLHRYGLHACVVGLAGLFFPLLLSACIAHGIGRSSLRLRRSAAPRR
jgi:hypothetical protein